MEWLLRHTLPFLLLVMMVRWVLRPQFGKRGVVEVLMVNAIGDMASHAAFEEGHPLLSGLGAVALWVLFASAIAWLVSRSPAVGSFFGYFPEAVEVVRDGKAEMVTMRELRMSMNGLASELRKAGIKDIRQVQVAMIEPDGALAVRQVDATGRAVQHLSDATTAELQRLAGEIAALRAELAVLHGGGSAALGDDG